MRFTTRVHRRSGRVKRSEATDPELFNQSLGPPLPEEATVNAVMDLGLRVGEVLMASGAGAADVTATVFGVMSAYGLPNCEVDVIFTSISICCQRGTELAPVTAHRVVRSRSLDYTRLAAVEQLVHNIADVQLPIADAREELDRLTAAPHPYPRWVATVAWALMAMSVTVLIGGNLWVALISGVVTAVIDRVGRLLNRRALPFFFQQLVGGALATGITLAIMRLGLLPSGVQPSLVIAGSITVLLSGLSVVGTVQDAITGFNVTAAGRAMEVAMMSAGLVAGVVLALAIALQLGLPNTPVAGSLLQSVMRLPVQILAGAAAATAFALASYATLRALAVAAGAGALGAAVHGALGLSGVHPIATSAIAAMVVGFCGGVMSRRFQLPPLVIAVSGLTPLLPGLTTYNAIFQLAVTQTPDGLLTLVLAVAIALALAAGVVLGEYLAQPVRTGLGRLERRLAGPRLVGLLRPSRRDRSE